MRKIVLAAAAAATVILVLSACSDTATPAEVTPPEPKVSMVTKLSDNDKKAVDALGTDIVKLLPEWQTATGPHKEYAESQLILAIEQSADLEQIQKIAGLPAPSLVKLRAVSRKLQILKK